MAIHLIIDGYNLIRQSPSLSRIEMRELQKGREALIDRLAEYKKIKGYAITVVFDGWRSDNLSESSQKLKGIEVIFSKSGEKADEVIKRLSLKYREKGIIVTSDNEVASYAGRAGATVVDSPEFSERMEMAQISRLKGGEEEYQYPKKEKKGPSRKAPKAERKARERLKKL